MTLGRIGLRPYFGGTPRAAATNVTKLFTPRLSHCHASHFLEPRPGRSVCFLAAGRANQNERKIMKVLKRTPAIAAALAAVALAAAGCSSSGSSSSSAGGGSSSGSSGGTVDIYSSLPLHGLGKGGTLALYVNDQMAGEARMTETQPLTLGLGGALDIGEDSGSSVDEAYAPPFRFNGKIESVTVDLKK